MGLFFKKNILKFQFRFFLLLLLRIAYKYLKPAATRGAPTAQIELGHLYNKGNSIKLN